MVYFTEKRYSGSLWPFILVQMIIKQLSKRNRAEEEGLLLQVQLNSARFGKSVKVKRTLGNKCASE